LTEGRGSVDQHLPTLPAGVTYAFDDTRPKYLAYARRSKPGVVTVNKAALTAAIEGLSPANARAIVSKVVKHEIAHLAAFSAFTDAEIAEMARGMSMSEIDAVARRYYNSPDALTRLAADLESGAITNEALVEEYLRMQLELASDGSTTEATIAFHSNNPGFIARLVKYLRDALVALWKNVAGPQEDYVNRVAISRLAREYRAILRGHKPFRAEPFDPANPGRDDKYVAALARQQPTDPDADAASAAELICDPKDRAENVMIVDLLRNDLGRVCVPGSVHVPQLLGLESYAHVHHLTSVVCGQLQPGLSWVDLLRAGWPGGSISGSGHPAGGCRSSWLVISCHGTFTGAPPACSLSRLAS
jgi:hypothetical protein